MRKKNECRENWTGAKVVVAVLPDTRTFSNSPALLRPSLVLWLTVSLSFQPSSPLSTAPSPSTHLATLFFIPAWIPFLLVSDPSFPVDFFHFQKASLAMPDWFRLSSFRPVQLFSITLFKIPSLIFNLIMKIKLSFDILNYKQLFLSFSSKIASTSYIHIVRFCSHRAE